MCNLIQALFEKGLEESQLASCSVLWGLLCAVGGLFSLFDLDDSSPLFFFSIEYTGPRDLF
jgi:hypothetical protein